MSPATAIQLDMLLREAILTSTGLNAANLVAVNYRAGSLVAQVFVKYSEDVQAILQQCEQGNIIVMFEETAHVAHSGPQVFLTAAPQSSSATGSAMSGWLIAVIATIASLTCLVVAAVAIRSKRPGRRTNAVQSTDQVQAYRAITLQQVPADDMDLDIVTDETASYVFHSRLIFTHPLLHLFMCFWLCLLVPKSKSSTGQATKKNSV